MPAPRRRAFNSVNAASLARWIAITASLAMTGLIYVYLSLQLHELGDLQMIKHDEYAGLAAEKHVYKQAIYAERGSILDANNEVLAHNIPVETVVADATHLNNREALIPVLNDALKIPAGELSEKLGGDRRYIVLKREVPEAVA